MLCFNFVDQALSETKGFFIYWDTKYWHRMCVVCCLFVRNSLEQATEFIFTRINLKTSRLFDNCMLKCLSHSFLFQSQYFLAHFLKNVSIMVKLGQPEKSDVVTRNYCSVRGKPIDIILKTKLGEIIFLNAKVLQSEIPY